MGTPDGAYPYKLGVHMSLSGPWAALGLPWGCL